MDLDNKSNITSNKMEENDKENKDKDIDNKTGDKDKDNKEKDNAKQQNNIETTVNLNRNMSLNTRTKKIGLDNFGNSCYLNSIIQCLTYTSDLTHYFFNMSKEELKKTNKSLLITYYHQLILEICDNLNFNPTKSFKEFYESFIQLQPQFGFKSRQDAFEYLTILLNEFNYQLNQSQFNTDHIIDNNNTNIININISDNQKAFNLFKSKNNSIITECFVGQTVTTLQCLNCKHFKKLYEQFNSLMLPIPEQVERVIIPFIQISNGSNVDSFYFQLLPNTTVKHIKQMIILNGKINIKEEEIEVVVLSSKGIIEGILDNRDKPLLIYNNNKSLASYQKEIKEVHSVYYYLKHNRQIIFNKRISIKSKPTLVSDVVAKIMNQINDKAKIKLDDYITFNYVQSFTYTNNCNEKPIEKNNRNSKITIESMVNQQTYNEKYSILIIRLNPVFTSAQLNNFEQSINKNNNSKSKIMDNVNLDNCIDFFQSSSVIENWKCSNCKQNSLLEKQMKVCILPKYLIIRLKKRDISVMKHMFINQKQILDGFNTNDIDLTSHIARNELSEEEWNNLKAKYTLYGVVNLLKGVFHPMGHYIALCKDSEDKWNEFDDLSIKVDVKPENVVTEDSIIFFYKAIDRK